MADIFISYSKADRDKVAMLSAYLESEGWTVWWDKNLEPGQPYRDEIMRELAAARAVIVLWTPTSINSDFVRAEAGRAKADGKLIPVKTDDVGYGDIPLPFGEMHTESIARRELIRAAIVAQLAKPAVQPSAVWIATRTLRYQALTWLGIIGGAITVFANLRGILHLSVWANWVVGHWHEWTIMIWQWVFGLVQVRLSPHWAPILTFSAFALVTAAGQRAIYEIARKDNPGRASPDAPAIGLKQLLLTIALPILVGILLGLSLEASRGREEHPMAIVLSLASGLVMIFLPVLLLLFLSRYPGRSVISLMLVLTFYLIIVFSSGTLTSAFTADIPDVDMPSVAAAAVTAALLFYVAPPLMLWIAPVGALAKRLTYLGLGVVILIVLNALSKYSDAIGTLLKLPK